MHPQPIVSSVIRRRLLLGLFAMLGGPAPTVWAQARTGMVRVGFMSAGPDVAGQEWLSLLRKSLSELGYVEGRNLTLVVVRPDGTPDGMKSAVNEMVSKQPHLIITFGNEPVVALKRRGIAIPIVMTYATDPLGTGLVTNLSRPGGNVTGPTAGIDMALFSKQVNALHALLPKLKRVVVLTTGLPSQTAQVKAIHRMAMSSGISARGFVARDREELAKAFASAKAERAAILAWGDYPQSWMRQTIGQLGVDHKVPVVAVNRGYVEAGALLSVGVSPKLQFEMAARYADKILSGAKPGDLPIEHPTSTELVINGKTAAALGIVLSHEMRLRANEVIE